MATITTTKYSFKPPERISEMDYFSYKQMLEVDYNIDISPKEIPQDPGISFWKIAKWTALPLAFILAPAVVLSDAQSEISRSNAKRAMKSFYNDDLKRLINKYKNYDEFLAEYEKYFKQYLKVHFSMEYYMKYTYNK